MSGLYLVDDVMEYMDIPMSEQDDLSEFLQYHLKCWMDGGYGGDGDSGDIDDNGYCRDADEKKILIYYSHQQQNLLGRNNNA